MIAKIPNNGVAVILPPKNLIIKNEETMFICEKCATKRKVDSFYFVIAPMSRGNCELCNEYSACYDIHHSKIPDIPGGQNEPQVMQCAEPDLWEVEIKGEKCSTPFEISVIRKSNKHGHQSYGWFDDTKLLISHNGGPCHWPLTEKVWNKMILLAQDVAKELNEKEFGGASA